MVGVAIGYNLPHPRTKLPVLDPNKQDLNIFIIYARARGSVVVVAFLIQLASCWNRCEMPNFFLFFMASADE